MSNASLVLLTLSPTIENNENEDADFVSPLAKVIAVSWLAFLIACCYMYQKQESIRQEREEIERIAEIRRNERDKKLKPKERLNIIANKILQKVRNTHDGIQEAQHMAFAIVLAKIRLTATNAHVLLQ